MIFSAKLQTNVEANLIPLVTGDLIQDIQLHLCYDGDIVEVAVSG